MKRKATSSAPTATHQRTTKLSMRSSAIVLEVTLIAKRLKNLRSNYSRKHALIARSISRAATIAKNTLGSAKRTKKTSNALSLLRLQLYLQSHLLLKRLIPRGQLKNTATAMGLTT